MHGRIPERRKRDGGNYWGYPRRPGIILVSHFENAGLLRLETLMDHIP